MKMVVSEEIHNIMGGIENTGDVRLHNHRRKLKQRFDIVKKLGQGTYGKVQLGINKETGQEVAIKTIRKCKIETEADLIRIRREIQIMSSVRHPNIIHIYEVFENREKMVLVMEYAAGGELYDYLSERKVLTEDEARRIFRQIATAVYYCHKHQICHRDLKLENILLDEVGNAKIADFGLSNVFNYSALLSTFCGSPLYASPEIVKGTPYHGPEVDCWSLGVLLYTLVYGAMPFDGSNFKRLVRQISHGDYFEPKNPSPASQLITDMLNINPARRADITAICNHWWINETFSETCLEVAEELASQTPVRLDLLLSLAPPAANKDSVILPEDQVTNEAINGTPDKPKRSQSLGSIPPLMKDNVAVPVNSECKPQEKKPESKKKEHTRSKSRKRSRSRTKKITENKEPINDDSINQESEKTVVNDETIKIDGDIKADNIEEEKPIDVEVNKPKLLERRESKVLEAVEKLDKACNEKLPKTSSRKLILPGIDVGIAKKEYERRSSTSSTSPRKDVSSGEKTDVEDPLAFPLASTVALNKLVESALRDEEPLVSVKPEEILVKEKPYVKDKVANNVEDKQTNRKTSRAEIRLATPLLPKDNNFKTEVKHFVNKPAVNHRTEVVFPIAAPLPPKPIPKGESKEHIIPIQIESDTSRISPTRSMSLRSSIPRTSSSSLSRQSTVDSDSGASTVSTGEPIRKSAREVIIPIAVEGGGYVTPSNDTLNKISSVGDNEDDTKGSRCFTLRSTKRRQPSVCTNEASQPDTADSLSSDEDDNFQLLTAENLFSTLLSRVRNLTNRLNNDDVRRTSGFPRSFFTQHSSFFDNPPSRRLTETRSFSRPESAPWRRNLNSRSGNGAENVVTVHVPTVLEDSHVQ